MFSFVSDGERGFLVDLRLFTRNDSGRSTIRTPLVFVNRSVGKQYQR